MKTESMGVAGQVTRLRSFSNRLASVALGVLATLPLLLATSPAQAEVAQSPVFLTTPVNPNLILAIDDSGSMDAEVLMPTNDGALWWHVGNQSFASGSSLNFNNAGAANTTWKKYNYLFPNGTGITNGRRGYGDSTNDHFAIPPVPAYAFARSPEYNAAYFDPSETYTPWPDVGGNDFENASLTAAKTDPVFGTATLNLTVDRKSSSQNHVFRVYPGMTAPKGTEICFKTTAGGSCTWEPLLSDTTATTEGWAGIVYFPATFYLPVGAALPDGYGYIGDTTPSGYSPGATTPDLVRYEIKLINFSTDADYDEAIQNFANWFTYYRKRHLATRGGIAKSFENTSRLNAGSFGINNRATVTMLDMSDATQRNTFFQEVLSTIDTGGTPNREALNYAGQQFQRTDADAPIAYACQQNFTALFTDGFSNPTGGIVGNEDAGFGTPFEDSASGTIADIAMRYYKNNLRPDLETGRVLTQTGCADDPSLDCNDNLHMSTFGVVLGNQGQIYLVDEAATADPFGNPPSWPTTFPARHPSSVDDLWHATINSRGEMLTANRPSEVADKFAAVLNNIAGRIASASAVATNSTRLDSETAVLQAAFDSSNWSGNLKAFRVNPDGTINGTSSWAAADKLDLLSDFGTAGRKIFTVSPPAAAGGGSSVSGTGKDFLWSDLAVGQQAKLRNVDSDTVGQARLDYLRGVRAQEQANGPFRKRASRLGDIVNSDPQFAHKQDFGYALLDQSEAFSGLGLGASYITFRQSAAYQTRPPMIVVGANDGMLHGFEASLEATGGTELFAYVPDAVFDNLYELTQPDYTHRYFVDGTPRVADAYFGSAWHTIAVGVTGAGGRSVFALDITNPASMSKSSVLWEFNHPSMGYTMGQPAVAPLPNGKFGVVVTSGYDTGVADGVIWILNPADGSIIHSITLPNSGDLGTPLVVDLNSDRVADRIYVGDTSGKLWRVDLKGSNISQWKPPSGLLAGTTPLPLFIAVDAAGDPQAITAPLSSAFNDKGLHTLFFGTGSFYRADDMLLTDPPEVNSFYGIIDRGVPIGRGELLEQEILIETTELGPRVRGVTANEMEGHSGWFIDLVWDGSNGGPGPAGERVVSRASVRGDRLIFATIIPNPDPCDFGGDSWIMELNTFNGGRLEYAVLDLNGDGKYDDEDWITVGSIRIPSSGIMLEDNIITTPAIITGVGQNKDEEIKVMSGSSGDIEELRGRGAIGIGRQSWRQLR